MTDTVTGLIWLQDADCLGSDNWVGANQAAAGVKEGDCSLTDGSSAGDWRLPTRDEWQATVARAIALGCSGPAALTNDAGTACLSVGPSSFVGVLSLASWSSSSFENSPSAGKRVFLSDGSFSGFGKRAIRLRVWPVRGGAR